MSLPNTFSYHFYPVGQGLFSAGSIRRQDEDSSRFLWVYDCGTSSSQDLVDAGILDLKRFANGRRHVDLLVLSHFDYDHISGVVRLLKEFEVGTLLLPYMPLAQRLVMAFEEGSGGGNDPLTGFYLNPVAFLLAQAGPGVERILFVPPSGDVGPVYPGELPTPPENGPEDKVDIKFEDSKPEADDVIELIKAAHPRKKDVAFLLPGSRITLAACLWEFIPYNDDPQVTIENDFIASVANERDNLLLATNSVVRDKALKKLKDTYSRYFGKSSEERNVISLFLYSGPVYSTWKNCRLTGARAVAWHQARRMRWWLIPDMRVWEFDGLTEESLQPRCSILYSGDGYLDTINRLRKLTNYLHENRVRRISIFQVMHHGAEANWHHGVAAAIAPLFSVFSSDPERKKWKHPNAQVLRDFWCYGAVQVDKSTDFKASGHLSR